MALKVLVIDDSLVMRSVIKKVIKASGLRVDQFFEAPDGKEAMGILTEECLDLVVMDYHMPDMDGMELLNKMKKDRSLSSIPVIVISVEGCQQRVNEFLEKGAADFLKKPFTPEEARDKFRHVMGEEENGQESPDSGCEALDF